MNSSETVEGVVSPNLPKENQQTNCTEPNLKPWTECATAYDLLEDVADLQEIESWESAPQNFILENCSNSGTEECYFSN